MSDYLVKRLRKQSSAGRANHVSKADRLAAADRIEELEAKLAKAVETIDDLISTYVWIREDEYERGWAEMSNAIHEATFVQMELKGEKQ